MASSSTNGQCRKIQSQDVTEGIECAPARAMFRAMGYDDADLGQPLIGIANPAADVPPCNVHLDRVADAARQGIENAAGTPVEFGTITVSDGISMGTEGMKGTLISREVIADSVEFAPFAERLVPHGAVSRLLPQPALPPLGNKPSALPPPRPHPK